MIPEKPSVRAQRPVFGCLLVLCLLALTACEWSDLIDNADNQDNNGNTGDNTPPATDTNVPGLSVAVSASDFDTTLADVRRAIDNRATIDPLVTVDHQANARGVNRTLRPTTVILFDNPDRASALIAADPRAALDLPMRVLVYRDGAMDQGTGQATGTNQNGGSSGGTQGGNVAVAYTNAAYLAARYALDGAESGTLDAFAQDLSAIAADGSGNTPGAGAATGVRVGEGIEQVASDDDFTTTVDRLTAAINGRDSLTLVQTVDFQARGASRGLNPSTLLIFGNPNVGTQLMQSSQTAGVDLPQKMLVTADDSANVTLYYNDPAFIADRHGIDNRPDQVNAVADLLAQLASEAGRGMNNSSNATAGEPGAAAAMP